MTGVMSAMRVEKRVRPVGAGGRAQRRRGAGATRGRHAVDASQPLMDAADAAELLRVPSTWLLMAARDGRVPHHRIGRYVRFDLDELRTWLDETRVPMGRRPRKP